MNTVRAHIENGAVVLDEPLNLPDGTPVTVSISHDVDARVVSETDPEVEAAWYAEANRRSAQLHSGEVAPMTLEEVEQLLSK